jgi:predicted nucleotidyltransferase
MREPLTGGVAVAINGKRMDLERVREILLAHRSLFLQAYIHGSVARGTQDAHSDVDLVLVRKTVAPFFDRIREVFDLVFALGRADVLIYTEAEVREITTGPGRYFVKDVFAKGVLVEGAQIRGPALAPAG